MKVHILDDWFDTLRTLPCFDLLKGHDVTVWNDHQPDPAALAARIADAEALVLFRERTKITAELLAGCPDLKLISQRSVYPHVDVAACTDHGVLLCSNMHAGTPSYAAAEMTLALIAGRGQLPAEIAAAQVSPPLRRVQSRSSSPCSTHGIQPWSWPGTQSGGGAGAWAAAGAANRRRARHASRRDGDGAMGTPGGDGSKIMPHDGEVARDRVEPAAPADSQHVPQVRRHRGRASDR